jgi:hypothetical protein
MHVLQRTADPKRGPLADASAPHGTLGDPFQSASELCAVCHEVSNPFLTEGQDRVMLSPHEYAPMERTYSEWLMSEFPSRGDSGTCQSCHMKEVPGYICVYTTSPLRQDVPRHDLTGGNTFVPTILPEFWDGLDTTALADGVERARATLGRAATLALEAARSGDSVSARVRVTNETGHKLPTGYPDGRRIWIEITATSTSGDTVFRSGAYDADSARLVEDPQLTVYEAVFALRPAAAGLYGLAPGPSFHFALNDTLVKDNRIPPRGFTNAGFASRLAAPVGASYADGQYWDEVVYRLPGEAVNVTARLRYQTISREYIEFLESENEGNFFDWNDWGRRLRQAWEQKGRSFPEVMAQATAIVPDSTDGVGNADPTLPDAFVLKQNYPNPFNPATRLVFVIPANAPALLTTLRIVDVAGREIANFAPERLGPGRFERVWDAGRTPSGVYFAVLTRGASTRTVKMLLLR